MKQRFECVPEPVNLEDTAAASSPNTRVRRDTDLSEIPTPKKSRATLANSPSSSAAPAHAKPQFRAMPTPTFSPTTPEQQSLTIGQLFNQQFETRLQRSNNKKSFTLPVTHEIHTLGSLSRLIQEKKDKSEHPDFRVVIDSEFNARFARESHGRIPSPPHFGLVAEVSTEAQCLTAGNLFLSHDYTRLIKICNKSGDFTPSFDSLKWLIAILIINEETLPFKLPDILEVEHHEDTRIMRTYKWLIHDIKAWLTTAVIDAAVSEKLANQPNDTRLITLKVNVKPRSYFNVEADDMFDTSSVHTPVALPQAPSSYSAPPVARSSMSSFGQLQYSGPAAATSNTGSSMRTPMKGRYQARCLFGSPISALRFDDEPSKSDTPAADPSAEQAKPFSFNS